MENQKHSCAKKNLHLQKDQQSKGRMHLLLGTTWS